MSEEDQPVTPAIFIGDFNTTVARKREQRGGFVMRHTSPDDNSSTVDAFIENCLEQQESLSLIIDKSNDNNK